MNRFQVRTGHGEDVRGAIDEGGGERLAAQTTNVDAFITADFDRVKTWRLAAHRIDAGGGDRDVLAIAEKLTQKPFRNRTSANITRTNKEDAFHETRRARRAAAT